MCDAAKGVSRRGFLASAGAAAVASSLATGAWVREASASELPWDEEHEFVIVGSGNALYAALAAQKAGHSDVLVLEKAGAMGGTMKYSEGAVWIPGNRYMAPEYKEKDTPEYILEFMMNCNIFGDRDEEAVRSWIDKILPIYDYLMDEVGVPFNPNPAPHDYYGYEGDNINRSLTFGDGEHYAWWAEVMEPFITSAGLDVRTNMPVTALITDDDGAVVGVEVSPAEGGTLRIRAEKGVLLATGGFDHNRAMVEAYQYPPIVGTIVPAEITGDGHLMGMAIGADVSHMGECYNFPLVATGEEGTIAPMVAWTMSPGCILVGPSGRRFYDEATNYDEAGRALCNIDTRINGGQARALSGNATAILDARCIAEWGWPGYGADQPEWLRSYDSLEELAEGEGIEPAGLMAEIDRYNKFCETGIDEDFHRGEGSYEYGEYGCYDKMVMITGHMPPEDSELPNWRLAPIGEPPFYAATMGRGSISTLGGLATNGDAQVLRGGKPIPGLYASGCCADAIIGGYPCGGFPNTCAVMGAVSAVNHALGMGLY